jgi:hypothetical protein
MLTRHLAGEAEENHEEPGIAGLRAEFWTRDLPNVKQEYWPLGRDIFVSPDYFVNTSLRRETPDVKGRGSEADSNVVCIVTL